MNWQAVNLADVAPSPWRNGSGSTRELLAWPAAGAWRVRVSVADIARDGPFSAYPGIERWFAVLEGEGVDLRVDGVPLRLRPGSAPLRFDGAAAVHCALVHGPTRDFNLMALPGAASLRRLAGPVQLTGLADRLVGLYAHGAPARIGAREIGAGSLAWCLPDAAWTFDVRAADAWWMEVAR